LTTSLDRPALFPDSAQCNQHRMVQEISYYTAENGDVVWKAVYTDGSQSGWETIGTSVRNSAETIRRHKANKIQQLTAEGRWQGEVAAA
jgi:hypothetical protein